MPAVDSTKKTASKQIRRGDPALLTRQPRGLEQVAS